MAAILAHESSRPPGPSQPQRVVEVRLLLDHLAPFPLLLLLFISCWSSNVCMIRSMSSTGLACAISSSALTTTKYHVLLLVKKVCRVRCSHMGSCFLVQLCLSL